MCKFLFALICGMVSWPVAAAQSGDGAVREELLRETKHFLESLSFVYSASLWFSYGGGLYFTTFTEQQVQQLEAMRRARSEYVALTDRKQRHELATKGVAASGVEPAWRSKLLLPYSDINENLTPTLGRRLIVLPAYKVLQQLGKGDVLVQDTDGRVYFVMDYGRAIHDGACTNGLFVKEGERTYTTQSGVRNTVEALTSVGLNAAERLVLERVSAEFRKQAGSLQKPPSTAPKASVAAAQESDEFHLLKARATDSNPYMQFLLAKAYLEGKGTQQDEKLGLQWMRRAEANGSGDARTYLRTAAPAVPPR